MNVKPEDLARFFETSRFKLERCLEPTMQCSKKAIRAHSIQNARVIDRIAKDGHVIAVGLKISGWGPEVVFKTVGRNKASTFTGFCADHDAAIFASLDKNDLDIKNQEQLFLLAYRSVTRELHTVMEGAARIQTAYSSRVRRGVDAADEFSSAGMMATRHLMIAFETFQYRARCFDRGLIATSYTGVQHDVVVLKNQPPCVAVSSLFSLDEIQIRDEVVRVVLNVLPISADTTLAIFSYADGDCQIARSALDRVLHSQGSSQKYELSKLIIGRIENFLISPSHFNSWSSEKIRLIKSAFTSTAMSLSKVKDHPDLMMF